MRELFIGRVIHSDNKQWQEDVNDLLEFNTSNKDDTVKWQKIEETTATEGKTESPEERKTSEKIDEESEEEDKTENKIVD